VTEIKGYTLRIQAATDSAAENVLIPYCWLRISSSGNIHCLVNGLEAELSRDGAWFRTGSDGTAHILIATTDASCHTLYVDCFCGGNSTPVSGSTIKVLNGVRLNPSTKLTAKLSSIKTGDDLLACRTQKGESVLGTNISREDANKAAAAIAMLVSQAEKADARDAHHFANHVSSLQRAQKNVNLANSQPLQLSVWDDIGDAASDAWGWVEDRGHDVVDWAAEVVGEYTDFRTRMPFFSFFLLVSLINQLTSILC
jgi:hypothetical protein